MDGFTQMLDEAMVFFQGLGANNSRDWFEPRKDHYVSAIRKPAEMLAEFVAEDLSRMTGIGHAGKVFRIYRDVRFSKDKTPYNAHLHVVWRAVGSKDGALTPAFFFGAEPGSVRVGMGMAAMDKDGLLRFRAMVDDWGDVLADHLGAAGGVVVDFGDAPLKKPPAPYARDHRHAELLCRKTLIVMKDLGDGWRQDGAGLIKGIRAGFDGFLPLHGFLQERLA